MCNTVFMLSLIDRLRRHQGDFAGGQGETNEEGIQLPKRLKLSCATEGGQHVFVKKKCQEIRLSWEQCCPLPVTMSTGRAVANGNSVYVYDFDDSSKIYEYDISKNIWCNEIQCPRTSPSLVVVNGLLTIVGGSSLDSRRNSVIILGSNTLLSLVESPKDGTKQWSELLKPMHIARCNPVSTCNGEYLVVAGGLFTSSVEVMTIDTQEWHNTFLPKNDGDIGSATIIRDNLYITFVHNSISSSCSVITSSLTKLAENSTSTQGVVKPLLWHKLQGPPLYKACTVQLCGNLLAIGGKVTKEDDYEEKRNVYKCNGSAYAFDEEKGKWVLVCRLPSDIGFPDHQFVIASLSDERIIVIGGTQYTNNEDESPPHSDIVHVGSVL